MGFDHFKIFFIWSLWINDQANVLQIKSIEICFLSKHRPWKSQCHCQEAFLKLFFLIGVHTCLICCSGIRVARSNKFKTPNLAISSFKKAKSSNWKRPNIGQIFFKIFFVKKTDSKLEFRKILQVFAHISPKEALKYTSFYNSQKRPKNDQMAKIFYFWQTVSKRPNGNHEWHCSYFEQLSPYKLVATKNPIYQSSFAYISSLSCVKNGI